MIGNSGKKVAGAAGETTSMLEGKGMPALVMADGPAGIRINKDYTLNKKGQVGVGSALPGDFMELLPPVALALMNPKLPFARPTDPLDCERASRDDRAWWRYVLPQAVVETKQAAGRLIRKADDRGVLILADKRLITKRYGKTFLNSLQSRTVRVCSVDEIAASLRVMGSW